MLHTNEPANKIMVALSAYRATNSTQRNIESQVVLLNALKAGSFEILDDNMTGYYCEEGQPVPTVEQSVMVLCNDLLEVGLLARIAKEGFNQDCIMAVTTQTHTTRFVTYDDNGQVIFSKAMGTLQQVKSSAGIEAYTIDSTGNVWAVIS
ncbi:MAG: hypothetical protein [Caudoviricetes sp.]|nr:MAG: hypothetical protein [Caudoviricetes sp.]